MNRQKALFEFDGALSYQARAFASLHLLAAAYRSTLDSNEETNKLQHEKKIGPVKKIEVIRRTYHNNAVRTSGETETLKLVANRPVSVRR